MPSNTTHVSPCLKTNHELHIEHEEEGGQTTKLLLHVVDMTHGQDRIATLDFDDIKIAVELLGYRMVKSPSPLPARK